MVPPILKWQCNIIFKRHISYIDDLDWIVEIEYGMLGCSQYVAYQGNFVFLLELNSKWEWKILVILGADSYSLFHSAITHAHYVKTESFLSPNLTIRSSAVSPKISFSVSDFCFSSLLGAIAPLAVSPNIGAWSLLPVSLRLLHPIDLCFKHIIEHD